MKEVTDPSLLAKLNAAPAGKEVTDPALLSQLNAPEAAPKEAPQSMAGFVGGNVAKGVAQTVGPLAEKAQEVVDLPSRAFNKALEFVTGGKQAKAPQLPLTKEKLPVSEPALTAAGIKSGAIGPSAEPRTSLQRYGAAALQALPSAALPGGGASALGRIGGAVGAGLGGEAGRQLGGAPGQVIGGMIGGGLGGLAGAERGIPKPPSEAQRASQASGIPLTIGQQAGNPPLTGLENILGASVIGSDLAVRDRVAQIDAGIKSVNKIADRISANPENAETLGTKLSDALTGTVKKIDKLREDSATEDYGKVRALAGENAPVIPYKNTLDTLDKIIAENKGVPAGDAKSIYAQATAMRKELSGVAKPPVGQRMTAAQYRQMQTPAAPTAKVGTIDQAMRTRRAWGMAARRTGRIFTDIDQDADQVMSKRLFAAINKDFEEASTQATPYAQALKQANRNYAKYSQSIDFIRKSTLAKLVGEDVVDAAFTGKTGTTKAPELLAQRYLSLPSSQARQVTTILKEHAPAVLEDAKAYMLRDALEKAGSGQPGRAALSFDKFISQIEKQQPKLKELGFSDKDIADIKDITDTMARASTKYGVNPAGTAQAAQISALTAGFIANPAATLAAVVGTRAVSYALLTPKGRDLIRAAMSSGAPRAAAIGTLRSLYATDLASPQTDQTPTGAPQPSGPQTSLPPPPTGQ